MSKNANEDKSSSGTSNCDEQSSNQDSSTTNSNGKEVNAKLRLVRTELTDINTLIGRAKTGKITIDQQIEYLNLTRTQIAELFVQIEELDNKESDTIRHILNLWEQIERGELFKDDWQKRSTEQKLEAFTLLEEQIQEIVLYVGYKTIPERVNDWLDKARPGYVLPFHLVFEDEIHNEGDRKKVLNYISWKPTEIEKGLVDPGRGLVFRYHENEDKRKIWATAIVALFPILILLVGAFGPDLAPLLDKNEVLFKLENAGLLLLALFSGIYVHLLIDRNKQQTETGLPSIVPLSEWTRYLSAHRGRILYKTSLALFAFFGLIAIAEKPDSLTYTQFFLAGYSLDSVVDMLATRLERSANSRFASPQG